MVSKQGDPVKSQYEDYPYPPRNPQDEKKRLTRTQLANLALVNHTFWRGKRKLDQNFRVLDAGCGTGDGAVFLAEQLKGSKSEIIALDFSKNSIKVAKERLKMRKLDNVTFIQDSIFSIPKLNIGKFDYILCSGVLHHLEDPLEGLKILANSLKDDGGIGIMIYGKYGRTAVYMMQELLRMVNTGEENVQRKIENAKLILQSIKPTHWFEFSKGSIGDLFDYGDVGIYDLLLHSRDRAYTVPEIYQWSNLAGLKVIRFVEKLSYDPKIYLSETPAAKLLEKIESLSEPERQAIAELLNSRMKKHAFFLTKEKNVVPSEISPKDLAAIPTYFDKDVGLSISSTMKNIDIDKQNKVKIKIGAVTLNINVNRTIVSILQNIDDKTPLKKVLDKAAKNVNISYEEAFKQWISLYETVKYVDLILLNAP